MSTLEQNLLTRRVDGALATPLPKAAELPPLGVGTGAAAVALQALATPASFTPAEARAVGLIDEAAVDWREIHGDALPQPRTIDAIRDDATLADDLSDAIVAAVPMIAPALAAA